MAGRMRGGRCVVQRHLVGCDLALVGVVAVGGAPSSHLGREGAALISRTRRGLQTLLPFCLPQT